MHGRLQLGMVAALLVLGALGLSGCGVRGSLDAPPDAKVDTGNANPGQTGQSPGPHRPFVLDPLIR